MRHQSHSYGTNLPIDAGPQVAQLRHVLRLVEELAGRQAAPAEADAALDQAAQISSLYLGAEPIVQRRFGVLAAQIGAWSAAGVEALLAAGESRSPAAVHALANELEQALFDLSLLLQPAVVPETSGATPSL
jgi:hypothetical protein